MHNVNHSTMSEKWTQRLQGKKSLSEVKNAGKEENDDFQNIVWKEVLVLCFGWLFGFFFFFIYHQVCEAFCSVKAKFPYNLEELYHWRKHYTTQLDEKMRPQEKQQDLPSHWSGAHGQEASQKWINTGFTMLQQHMLLCHITWDCLT